MSVISLSEVIEVRNRPDASLLSQDDLGRELRTYAFDYEMDGETWGFSILAYSMEDAERRSRAIRSSVKLCGEIRSGQWHDSHRDLRAVLTLQSKQQP